jgi:hypothetical protein
MQRHTTPLLNALRAQSIKAEQDRREPLRASIRQQVAALTASLTSRHQSVATRNREAFVTAVSRTKTPGQVYAGTVPQHVIDKRRARDRMARASRKVNRRHG